MADKIHYDKFWNVKRNLSVYTVHGFDVLRRSDRYTHQVAAPRPRLGIESTASGSPHPYAHTLARAVRLITIPSPPIF